MLSESEDEIDKKRIVFGLSIIVVILIWFSTGMGLFYSDGGQPRFAESIYLKYIID